MTMGCGRRNIIYRTDLHVIFALDPHRNNGYFATTKPTSNIRRHVSNKILDSIREEINTCP
jgi:hypothetical protein